MHAQGHACNRRARRNARRDVEGKHSAADPTHGCLASEKIITNTVADVAISRNVLIERIVFAGVDIDSRRTRKIGIDADKREYQGEESYTLGVH
jgi:hypothetical protein